MFQYTAARRRLGFKQKLFNTSFPFQHTAARRRLDFTQEISRRPRDVSTHSRPKTAGSPPLTSRQSRVVSTHSRLKAAGQHEPMHHPHVPGFNTQPPEGGWEPSAFWRVILAGFNTQPPEGGWDYDFSSVIRGVKFQHTAA